MKEKSKLLKIIIPVMMKMLMRIIMIMERK
jgi:hypothetical protein